VCLWGGAGQCPCPWPRGVCVQKILPAAGVRASLATATPVILDTRALQPYTPALYDILDATGVLCWDENREFTARTADDMEALVRRDRNHPSVVVWSACNEIECMVSGGANQTGRLMRDAAKRADTTRPFSANSWYNGNDSVYNLAAYVDVEGFSHGGIVGNGGSFVEKIHALNPGKGVVSSECCSCQTQRGEDFADAPAGISYPASEGQAKCMQNCMSNSYPSWRGNPSKKAGVVAGTLGGRFDVQLHALGLTHATCMHGLARNPA
jgi:hypothetical protein